MSNAASPSGHPSPTAIEAVRHFNRFYTRRVGVLQEGLLRSEFTLTEARVLWELAHVESTTAGQLAVELDLDAGYLSRILRGFRVRGFLTGERGSGDGRTVQLRLTRSGQRAFTKLDEASQGEVGKLLSTFTGGQARELLEAMAVIERLLGDPSQRAAPAPYLLRPLRAGDLGWVVSRHGAVYAQEFKWDASFEALVARIAAEFVDHLVPSREACWIAERDGANVGCVFLVQARDEATGRPLEGVAQLRLLLVEPAARGLGVGRRLVEECTHFARHSGYRTVRLWTNSCLSAARRIYETAGYRLVSSEPHHSFGHDLVGEVWELDVA